MCRASGAVFYLDIKVYGAVFYSDTREMRGVLFRVTHSGPSTPIGKASFIFVYVIDIIFP